MGLIIMLTALAIVAVEGVAVLVLDLRERRRAIAVAQLMQCLVDTLEVMARDLAVLRRTHDREREVLETAIAALQGPKTVVYSEGNPAR